MPPKTVKKQNTINLDMLRKELKGEVIDLDESYEYFLTGNPIFDAYIGSGGFPKYQLEYIWASSSIGKSTLAIQILASYLKQNTNSIVVYLDSEESVTKQRLSMLGVDYTKVLITNPTSIETVKELIDKIRTSYNVDIFMIWDTLIQTPSKEETEGYSKIGMQARSFSTLFKTLRFYDSKLTMFALNQHRENMQGQYMPPDPPGGNAVKHKSFLTLYGTSKKSELIEPEEGKITTFTTIKSKVISPKRKMAHVLTHVDGYDSILTTITYLKENKLLGKRGGGYYHFIDEDKNYRLPELYKFFTTDESVPKWKMVINDIFTTLYPDDDIVFITEAKDRILNYYFENDKFQFDRFTSLSKKFVTGNFVTNSDNEDDTIEELINNIDE